MAIDPTIPLGIKVPTAQSSPTSNPLGLMNTAAEIQNRLNTARLFQQEFQAKQVAGELLSQSDPNDPEAGIRALMQDPRTAAFAGPIISSARQAELTLLQMQGEQQSQSQSGLAAALKGLPAVMADPSQWDAVMGANLATLSPTARQRVAPAITSLKESLTAGLPSDPAMARTLFNQRLTGLMVGAGITPDSIRAIVGTPTTRDIGGAIESGVQAPPQLGGGFIEANAQGKTLAPQLSFQPFGPGGSTVPFFAGGAFGDGMVPGRGTATPAAAAGPVPGEPRVNALGTVDPAFSSPSQTNAARNTKRGDQMATYQDDLDTRVTLQARVLQNAQEARDALARVRAGGGATAYAALGQVAQAFGAPKSLVDRIANGSLAASQEFNKLAVNNVMGQIEQQLPNSSRMSQMEFAEFKRNNPNLDTDPDAIEKIYDFWGKVYNMDHSEQGALNKYLAQGGDISQWPAKWQDEAQRLGFFSSRPGGAQGSSRPPLSSFFK